MKVSVKRTKIVKDPINQVTSSLIMMPHRRQMCENLKVHPEGIFSKKIFGNFKKCGCGKLLEVGFCEICETRVISIEKLPDFFIDLTIKVPASFADYKTSGLDAESCESLIHYRKFLCDGEICEITEDNPSFNYEGKSIKIGLEALRELGVSEEWIEENSTDVLGIPHTIYRPIVMADSDKPLITDVNAMYSDIVARIEKVKEMHDIAADRPLFLMAEYRMIARIYDEIITSLFSELQDANFSILKSEIIAHPISGAVRSTIINRHDLNEDVLLIGDTLIETLFPRLYKKYKGNMVKINEDLVKIGNTVLLNRPPTIAHLSIGAMYPRVMSCYKYGKIEETNGGLLHNTKAVWEKFVPKNENNNGGDIEKFGQGLDDGVDDIGLRCLALNPIITDGYQMDFDGDVGLVVALYSRAAIEESKELLPSNSYINFANGTIRNHIIEDFIYAL